MSKTNTWETGLLNLLFNNTDFTGVGDAGGLLATALGAYKGGNALGYRKGLHEPVPQSKTEEAAE